VVVFVRWASSVGNRAFGKNVLHVLAVWRNVREKAIITNTIISCAREEKIRDFDRCAQVILNLLE
jgi:hypothetical protein